MKGFCLKFLVVLVGSIYGSIWCGAAATLPEDDPEPYWLEVEIKKAKAKQDLSDPRDLLIWVYEKGREMDTEGKVEESWQCFMQYLTWLKDDMGFDFVLNPYYEHSDYWIQTIARLGTVKRFCVDHKDYHPAIARLCYEIELFTKGLMLDFGSRVRRKVLESGDEEFIAEWNDIMRNREVLESIAAINTHIKPSIEATRNDSKYADHHQRFDGVVNDVAELDSIVREAESILISELAKKHPDLLSYTSSEQIVESLREGDAFVEYFTFPGEKDEMTYGAIVMRAEFITPRIEILGKESRLLQYMDGGVDFECLYNFIWAPIKRLIEDCREIYVIPTGLLHKVPFAGLGHSAEYISERHIVRTLLSSRDIINIDTAREGFADKTILLLGGADFDYMSDRDVLSPDMTDERVGSDRTSDLLRSSRGQGFGYLPGSIREIKTVSEILTNRGWDIRLLTDTYATKTNLRNDLTKAAPSILHLSTHGFWIPSPVSDSDPNRNMFRVAENPLMRSGLVFSGVNVLWNKVYTPGIDNGVLTAQEISRMNLSGIELVVLSACETGAGAINDSEGVYGLQRGFRLAGAGKMLVSLWEIPDKETTDMMISFYRYLVAGHSVKQAFDTARKEMRVKNPDNPESWAGFVLIE